MPTKRELYESLDALFPTTLSEEWDNDGLMCCSHPDEEAKKILFTLDVTPDAIDFAADNGFDTIISHHPLIFKGIKALNTDLGIPKRLLKALEANIAVMSFHTRFDTAKNGVNDALASILELSDITEFGSDEGKVTGRIGTLEHDMSDAELALFIKEKLRAPYVNYNGTKKKIRRLAVLGGAGDDMIEDARRAGADAYLTGELGHHALVDACDLNMTLYEAGHHFTEAPSLDLLYTTVQSIYPNLICAIYEIYSVKTV